MLSEMLARRCTRKKIAQNKYNIINICLFIRLTLVVWNVSFFH